MKELTHLSLCSGIGGIDLAAEWAGFKTVGQCEIDDYASKVLEKNFKGVHNFGDIRTVNARTAAERGIERGKLTVISAGFPCQPYSLAGKGLGDNDSRDLWGEVARILGELKPKWFVGENTPGLFARQNQRYFRRILNDLTAMGYSVGWGIWGACDVGANHKRDRVFIMAHADGKRRRVFSTKQQIFGKRLEETSYEAPTRASVLYGNVSDAACEPTRRLPCGTETAHSVFGKLRKNVSDADGMRKSQQKGSEQDKRRRACDGSWWQVEPDVGRMVNGVSHRVDRLKCLGNAVVPQQVYPVFQAIAKLERC